MSEGLITQKVRTSDPVAAPVGFVTIYNKNGQYYFINNSGTITAIPLDAESTGRSWCNGGWRNRP